MYKAIQVWQGELVIAMQLLKYLSFPPSRNICWLYFHNCRLLNCKCEISVCSIFCVLVWSGLIWGYKLKYLIEWTHLYVQDTHMCCISDCRKYHNSFAFTEVTFPIHSSTSCLLLLRSFMRMRWLNYLKGSMINSKSRKECSLIRTCWLSCIQNYFRSCTLHYMYVNAVNDEF